MGQMVCFFQVAFLGGIEVRCGPDYGAQRTGLVLMQNEVFAVSQQVPGTDGRMYLCLADGQGWVFDDSALVPHDPSVVLLPSYAGPQAVMGLESVPALPWSMQSMPSAGPDAIIPPPLPLPGVEQLVPQVHPVIQSRPMPPPPPSHPAPCGELLASTPTGAVLSQPQPPLPVSWFRVSYLGGINLRLGPSIDAPCAGATLPQMEVFPVAEEVPGQDGRVYLRLCDGRGWAFDDSALMPHDPSVKRGNWMASCDVVDTRVLQEVQTDALPVRRRMHPQPRGKRGGKRCTRRAKVASSSAGPAAEG